MYKMWLLVLAMTLAVEAFPRRFRRETETPEEPKKSSDHRRGKALGYYQPSYMNNPVMFDPSGLLQYEDALAAALASATYSEGGENEENEILSRMRPGSKKPGNSPIYYIRLPPTPYIYIPGVGYVSNPPTLQPPPVVQRRPDSQFLNVPVRFVSNGKPTGVYTLENDLGYSQSSSPPKDSPITTLDKGPYVFNGRPTDIYLLRDAYNSLYADALTNFYP
ncbi:uncharacterized protein LOC129001796 [Macrosteles quadrilineatus]|uniref:uncharacterized protein LOC129000905 n=1 Tax=Macrosteles quadrilineatus TaxID=74068 RepID=UPI0023E12899|nr:uncharacterized protein LOC129000905 [Macrosteles quadrilineatus]XP_054285213.1 uncharacterized protein LOC129001796 [Macrosteles quadrilineatus]